MAESRYVKSTPGVDHQRFKDEGKTWDEFRAFLFAQYEPQNLVDNMKKKLLSLKMQTGPDGFENYVRRFESYAAKLKMTDLDEGNRLFMFKQGLKPRLLQLLETRATKVTTLASAIEICRRLEETRGEGEARVNTVRVKGGKINNDKRYNSKGVDRRVQDKTCYGCGEKGHLASMCPKDKGEKPKNGNNKQFGRPRHYEKTLSKVVTCHRCQETGHVAKNCRKAKKSSTMVANVVEVNVLTLVKELK